MGVLGVLRLSGAVNTISTLGRLEAVLTAPLRSGRTETGSWRRTEVKRSPADMPGTFVIIIGIWYISSGGLAMGGVAGLGVCSSCLRRNDG